MVEVSALPTTGRGNTVWTANGRPDRSHSPWLLVTYLAT
jgi:hypothetical protein